MTTYVEKIIPGGSGDEFYALFGLLVLPLGAGVAYTETPVPAVTYAECSVPVTVLTECPVPLVTYTEKEV